MFLIRSRAPGELEAKSAAINRSTGIIEFDLAGNILTANENFLSVVGYSLQEIQGKHHSLFADPSYARSSDYRLFWERLARGEFIADKFHRIGKGGREIWIQASYNPLLDAEGKPFKIVKFATDITAIETQTRELNAKMTAIGRSMAVIEFNLDGTIITANKNFLDVVGYSLAEVVGRHHSMFVDRSYAVSPGYRAFWERLNHGEFFSDKFRRVSKSGKDVWIQASYNPLLDDKGKPFKVVKFATDVTALEEERRRNDREKEQRAAQTRVVNEIGAGLVALSEGNMVFRLCEPFAPEYEELRANFNEAIAKLQVVLAGIVDSAESVRAGTADMAAASDELSKRTEQQAASLEETTAALNEITSTVKRTAMGSKKASDTMANARKEAEHGGDVVSHAIGAMQQIEASSQKVSQIIGVIDEIAFQTNLLALNAGVEAARAGEAGRGFAVVASEVRALAQRSAEAAKEIKALISTSTQQVGAGAKLVGETGDALQRIVARVSEIGELVASIAHGAEQQATGLGQINVAIGQLDQGTQQNAAMVEETTAAVHGLSNEADSMARQLAKFDLGGRQENGPQFISPEPRDRATLPVNGAKRMASVTKLNRSALGAPLAVKSGASWEQF